MPMTTPRIVERPSFTAKVVCYMRALAYLEVGPPVANDHLAVLFLSPRARESIQSPEQRAQILAHEIQSANYSYLTARTRHLDRLFEEALTDGTKQIVILGAGYDSRAYRFPVVPESFKVYEVDAPTTQAAKRQYLDWANIDIPPHVRFVPINFNVETLHDALHKHGYDPSVRTLFLWEGVTYYISAEAVDNTLAFIREHAGPESRVAFDSIYAHTVQGDYRDHGAESAVQAVAQEGEPFVFGIPEGEIASFLEERGFTIIEHHTPETFQATYLDERFLPMYGFMLNTVAAI